MKMPNRDQAIIDEEKVVKVRNQISHDRPRGTYIILSAWMIRTGELFPRLVTAYVE